LNKIKLASCYGNISGFRLVLCRIVLLSIQHLMHLHQK